MGHRVVRMTNTTPSCVIKRQVIIFILLQVAKNGKNANKIQLGAIHIDPKASMFISK